MIASEMLKFPQNTDIPEGPTPHPLWGNAKPYLAEPLGYHEALTKEFGSIYSFYIGRRRLLAAHHPAFVKEVLQTSHTKFCKAISYKKLKGLLGEGLLTMDQPHWKPRRQAVQQGFKQQRLDYFFDIISKESQEWVNTLKNDSSPSQVFDFEPLASVFALKIIGKSFLGPLGDESIAQVHAHLGEAMMFMIRRIIQPVTLPLWLPIPSHISFAKAVKSIRTVVQESLKNLKSSKDHFSLVQLLDEIPDLTSSKAIEDELLTFFLAGHETTAMSICWSLYALSQNSEVSDKLYEECNSFPSNQIQRTDLSKLPYLQAVVKEVLRLYPPIWIIAREATEDLKIAGISVPKGLSVVLSPYILHRDPTIFEAADEFRPERFLISENQKKYSEYYIPFGAGPRTCIGNHFAEMELQLFLFHFIRAIKIEWKGAIPLQFQPSLTLKAKTPFLFSLQKR